MPLKNTTPPPRTGRTNRRSKILEVAERLLLERGLTGVTTRAIAEAVPCSEGAIYVHFHDRLELLLAVLQDSLPHMLVPLHALKEKAGTRTPSKNLVDALSGLFAFHERVVPMLCALLGDAELLKRFQSSLGRDKRGPHLGVATLADYIRQEQKMGRIAARVHPDTAASILMASSFFAAFTQKLLPDSLESHPERLVSQVLQK